MDIYEKIPRDIPQAQRLNFIFANTHIFTEAERVQVIFDANKLNYSDFYLDIIKGLEDTSRKVRRTSAKIILQHMANPTYRRILFKYLSEYSYHRRKYVAHLFGQWSSKFWRQRYYYILRHTPVNERTEAIKEYIRNLSFGNDPNVVFDAIRSLELIGDFRAIPYLKSKTFILKSQIKKRMDYHDSYSNFLIILRHIQHPDDKALKLRILQDHLGDLLDIARAYGYPDYFNSIFSDLGLFTDIIKETFDYSLVEKLEKTLGLQSGSWGFVTMIWLLAAEYPTSINNVEDLLSKAKNDMEKEKLEEIQKNIMYMFNVTLDSGFVLFL